MRADPFSLPTLMSTLGWLQFSATDALRRAQGVALGALGLGPTEARYEIAGGGPYWRLRDYGGADDDSPPLMIVAAPIKRPYIWDLSPSASAVRYCLRYLHVYLIEWVPPSNSDRNDGLDEYMQAISECVAKVSNRRRNSKPFLIGHSLGGTLAAIFAAVNPESIRALVLLGAPLCFQPATSQFRDTLVSMVPSALSDTKPFPGSLLSSMSALASPSTFVWSRYLDAALSSTDRRSLDIHARVERWALDEVPLPGRLVHQIIDWLYRENRLCRGVLPIGDRLFGPSSISAATLAIVNTDDEIAPLASVAPFISAMPTGAAQIIQYPGEVGVCLQHLAILVGRRSFMEIWPQIIAWLDARRSN
jgi:polyhydroxyalkanoate synthase